MHALAAGPAPAPRRQIVVGVTLGSVAMTMLIGGMLAIWARQRRIAIDAEGSWLPSGVTIPEVPSNIMLIAFIAVCSFAQWAVWSAHRDDRAHTVMALGATMLTALMVINAQAFIYSQMGMGVTDGTYATMFYAITGAFTLLMIVGVTFSVVSAFRFLGGRRDSEVVVAHAVYWYAMAAVYAALWFVVYVTK